MKQLREFAQHEKEFDDLQTQVVALSSDDQAHARQAWESAVERRFPVLADPDRSVIRSYGLVHAKGNDGEDIALRTTLFIDEKGVMRWWLVSKNVLDVPKAADTLKRIRETL